MTIKDRFNILKEQSDNNIDEYLNLFEEDVKDNSELIKQFFDFFQHVFQKEEHQRIKEIAERYYKNVEKKYLALEAKYNLDILTNCYNRNYLIELEDNKIQDACICYIDLDKLKKINDKYGHIHGDLFLKEFSKILQKTFSNVNSHTFRYGGDEFVVIVYNSNRQVIEQLLNDLYENTMGVDLEIFDLSNIRFSCGVYFADQEILLRDAMVLADKAMYICKEKRKQAMDCKYIIYKD